MSENARKLLIALWEKDRYGVVSGVFTIAHRALNIRAFSVQKRPLLAFDVQIRGEGSRPQSFPIRRFAWSCNPALGCCGISAYIDLRD